MFQGVWSFSATVGLFTCKTLALESLHRERRVRATAPPRAVPVFPFRLNAKVQEPEGVGIVAHDKPGDGESEDCDHHAVNRIVRDDQDEDARDRHRNTGLDGDAEPHSRARDRQEKRLAD